MELITPRIIEKPWGREVILFSNAKFTYKKLYMMANNRCSLQFHQFKNELIIMQQGHMKYYEADDSTQELIPHSIIPGDMFYIKPGIIHRMEAITDIIYFEISTSELDDVIRLEDDYNRIESK